MPKSIGIIGGTGPEGKGLAARFAQAGFEVLIGSRSAERGEEAATRQRRLRDAIDRYGLVVSGPNSQGIANLLVPMVGTFTPVLEHVDGPLLPEVGGKRKIAVVSQSGGVAFA